MRFTLAVGLATLSAVLLAPIAANADHCTTYRGPAGQVPPQGRTPQDPTPAPGPSGGTTPGGGSSVGGTTPAGLGVTPGPGGLPTAPRAAGAGGTAAAGPRGGTTPTGRRKASAAEGFERWEFWWEHNKDAHLNLKTNLADIVFTSSSEYFLGKSENKNFDVVEPTQQILDAELTPALSKIVNDDFYLVRDAAVIAMAKVGGEAALETLTAKLADDNRYVQESAVISLGILGDKAAVPSLLSILNADAKAQKLLNTRKVRPELRAYAAVSLGLIGDEAALPQLMKLTRTEEARKDAPVAATLALGLMASPTAVDHLISLVKDPSAEELVRAHATTSLGKLGETKAIPAMLRALRDKSTHVSRSAVIALGLLGTADNNDVVKALTQEVVKGSDIQSRNWACIALGQIGGDVAKRSLLNTLTGERRSLQAFAALGLGILLKENPDKKTVVYLRKALADAKEQSVRGAFAISLGLARDRGAEKELVAIMTSRSADELRGYAAVALGLMKAKAAAPVVQKILAENQKKPALARSAAISLGLMGDRDAIPTLTKVLQNAQVDEVRSSAALALGQIGDVTAIEPLLAQIDAKPGAPERTRAFATTALGIIGEDATLPVMSRLSRDSNYRAMVPAIQVLMSLL